MKHPRTAIGALSLSAAAFVALVAHEGYTDRAIVPVKGDRPTVGFGSTFKEDGTPVQMGDTITAPQAVKRSLGHISKDESALKQCVTGAMSQAEYDLLVDFSYQYGTKMACNSSIVRHINAGQYTEACQAYGRFKIVAGRDCSVRSNGCYGVYTRSQERVTKCMEAQ